MPKVRKSKPKGRSGGRGGGKRPQKSSRGGRGSGGDAQPEREVIHLKPPVTSATLGEALNMKPHEIVAELMSLNVMATINQSIDADTVDLMPSNRPVKNPLIGSQFL